LVECFKKINIVFKNIILLENLEMDFSEETDWIERIKN
jgi:hypothetical protein